MLNLFLFDLMYKLRSNLNDVFTGSEPLLIGTQLDNGVVVSGDSEFEYAGITDKKGNFFYLNRLANAETEYTEIETKTGSCCAKTYWAVTKIKLVAVYQRYPTETIEYKLKNQLAGGICIDSIPHNQRPQITLTKSGSDFETIYKAETLKQKAKTVDKSWRLTAIEFTLKYMTTFDGCNRIDNCCEINYETFCKLLKENGTLTKLIAKLKQIQNV